MKKIHATDDIDGVWIILEGMSETMARRSPRWPVTVPASSGSAKNLSTVNSIRATKRTRPERKNGNRIEIIFRVWQLRLPIDLRDRRARFYTRQPTRIESHFRCVTRFELTIPRGAIYKI